MGDERLMAMPPHGTSLWQLLPHSVCACSVACGGVLLCGCGPLVCEECAME